MEESCERQGISAEPSWKLFAKILFVSSLYE